MAAPAASRCGGRKERRQGEIPSLQGQRAGAVSAGSAGAEGARLPSGPGSPQDSPPARSERGAAPALMAAGGPAAGADVYPAALARAARRRAPLRHWPRPPARASRPAPSRPAAAAVAPRERERERDRAGREGRSERAERSAAQRWGCRGCRPAPALLQPGRP